MGRGQWRGPSQKQVIADLLVEPSLGLCQGKARQLSGQERLQLTLPAGFSRVEGYRACLLGQLSHGPHHLPSLRPV